MPPRAKLPFLPRFLLLVLMAALTTHCAKDVVDYANLRLVISSEPPLQPGATISAIQLAVRSQDGQTLKLPLPGKESELTFAIPAGRNIVTTPYTIDITLPNDATSGALNQPLQLRVLGVDGKTVLTTWSGTIDPKMTGEFPILLRAPQPACDADGDGVPDCKKAGCCSDDKQIGDCNDDGTAGKDGVPKGFSSSPFNREDPCTQCGNGLDEDCDGSDLVCLDSDKDGVPDCQEVECGTGAENDAAVYPGAVEICDGKDNDCNHQIDDALGTADDPSPTHKAGEACGTGTCAGGKWQCDAGGGKKPMQCSTKGNAKAEICENDIDDDCDGKINQGCALSDVDGDGVSNDVEKTACKYPFAMYHAEFHPKAPEKCCPIGATDQTKCDTNCDGTVTACDATDKDGDGWPASKDCDDGDPLSYPGAPEKCGDGKVQSCAGSDPACDPKTDADGDGWSAPADCNDKDKSVNPQGIELCNGVDDNCDGVVDNGNPEALDAKCGNLNGECGHKDGKYGQTTGILACKHYKFGQVPDDQKLDCPGGFDQKSATCVGCDGDQRPKPEQCNTLDDDCNAKTDEGFSYSQEDGQKVGVGQNCDGIGGCGVGVVECLGASAAVCSTDPSGSKPGNSAEKCDNIDNNCNGTTDENLTAIGDSTCEKVGVCAIAVPSIKTVCVAGAWRCDYANVPSIEISSSVCLPGDPSNVQCNCSGASQTCHEMIEVSCDGLDNDCDGYTDDDFVYVDFDGSSRGIGESCLTGACGGGIVVCGSDQASVTCSTSGKSSTEQCDKKDNDCDGKTDEAEDLPVEKSTCKQTGVCSVQKPVATCVSGSWNCDYISIPGWETPSESSCDGKDNDCDGGTDEDFSFTDVGEVLFLGETCGHGVCSGGKAECGGSGKNLVCSTTLANSVTEICDSLDNDCNGSTDEGFAYTQADGQSVAIGSACVGVGACGAGVVECFGSGAAICSSDAKGSQHNDKTEICDDSDNDCNGLTDEGCDVDGDGWCSGLLVTIGTPKSCPNGGGDCQPGNSAVHPSVAGTSTSSELCDGVDNDCSGSTDEIFFYSESGVGGGSFGVGKDCGLGSCGGGTVVCSGMSAATCSSLGKKTIESCNGLDDDCNGVTDDGCDDDGDGFCDGTMGWAAGASVTCPKTTSIALLDCDDSVKSTSPAALEQCNNVDDTCNGQTDEGCDSDGDQYCDGGMNWANSPTICPLSTSATVLDCDDEVAAVNPGVSEKCNGKDDNCMGGVDEGCDDDGDGYCDLAMVVSGKPAVCSSGSGDCNDGDGAIHPGATEVCDDVDNDCNVQTDEGCDDDGDKYCDAAMTTVGNPAHCTSGGGDCNDTNAAIHPGIPYDACSTGGVDDNCDGQTDPAGSNGCTKYYPDFDSDGYGTGGTATCLCQPDPVVTHLTATKTGDCIDTNAAVNPGISGDTCSTSGIDDNCDGTTDAPGADGCATYYLDSDGDSYGTSQTECACSPDKAAKFTATKSGDCNDASASINPGVDSDTCTTSNVDDNCDGQTDPNGAVGCTTYFWDSDGDGYGDPNVTAQCLCAKSGNFRAATGGDCDDTKIGVHPGATEACNGYDDNCDGTKDLQGSAGCVNYYLDGDADGYGLTSGGTSCLCTPDNANKLNATVGGDCDDSASAIHPGATEICNGVDDNCSGVTDEGVKTTFYRDSDGDTYGNLNVTSQACSVPSGYVAGSTDCNDNAASVHPGASESCNGVDDNCSGATDEGFSLGGSCGTGKCAGGTMVCSGDHASTVCSTAGLAVSETCNSIDDNCDGTTDEGVKTTFYRDADNDTYGNSAVTTQACSAPTGYVAGSTDCNDGANSVHPGATETCNGVDDNCNAATDETFTLGGACGTGKCAGGTTVCSSDHTTTVCSTAGLAVSETCNGQDDNCNGTTDEGVKTTFYKDNDGDTYGNALSTAQACSAPPTYVANSTDCNDNSSAVHPGAAEICNGIDDNCTGGVDEGFSLGGSCGVGKCAGGTMVCSSDHTTTVCSTAGNATSEICNSIDDNCDGSTDEGVKTTFYADSDGDSYGDAGSTKLACTAPSNYVVDNTDCNDGSASVHPGANEVCNGIDDNCSGVTDEGVTTTYYRDADGDTYGNASSTTQACSVPTGYVVNSTDCDDSNGSVHPGAAEICNGSDDNCNGGIDEGVKSTFYKDADGDTYGNASVSTQACSAPSTYVSDNTDCDDTRASVNPGATEKCVNLLDDNCDGTTDELTCTP